ncbi:MAG: Eco57I restriction-modification methylase domain-containing protein, partial [Candidatus Cloacimonetes bacterium]|nr:Eco57I restriction-modification methylase domain-containing protein [Candidatus Cloacimonadota bacterium]
IWKELEKLHHDYMIAYDKTHKDQLRNKIITKEWDMIKTSVEEHGKGNILIELEKVYNSNIHPFFLWKLHFAEVFVGKDLSRKKKNGFDIVIANPPYLKERDNAHIFKPVNESDLGKQYHCGKMDYWFYFLHKAIGIARRDSIITYITSRYWLNSSGAKKIIQHVEEELSFVDIVDIAKLKVFDNVVGHHMIGQYVKNKTHNFLKYKKLENCLDDINCKVNTDNIQISILKNKDIFKNNEILLTQQDFILSNCITLDEICDTSVGIQESPDKLSKKMLKDIKNPKFKIDAGVFVISESEFTSLSLNKEEQLVTEKYLDPNDVIKYEINYNKKYLIYTDKDIKKKIRSNNSFCHLKNHLNKFRNFITSSNAPYGLHRPREKRFFESPKIIFKNMFKEPGFCYDDENYYFGFSFSSIIQKDIKYDLKYILSILNSKFALNWFYKFGKQRGIGVDIGVKKLRKFPIKINEDNQQPFIQLVDQILIDKKAGKDTQHLEDKIDLMVYKLYELSYEEVKIVDPAFALTKEEYEKFKLE